MRAIAVLPISGGPVSTGTPIPTVVAAATATRPLPALGAEVAAAAMQSASLAAMADLFAVVVPDAATLPD